MNETLMNTYDGTINASETVDKKDVIIHFKTNSEDVWPHKGGGFRYGQAKEWKSRKKVLMVKVKGIKRRYEVDEKHCIDALVGGKRDKKGRVIKGDRDKMKVEWR